VEEKIKKVEKKEVVVQDKKKDRSRKGKDKIKLDKNKSLGKKEKVRQKIVP